MKIYGGLFVLMFCLANGIDGKCDVPLHFQFVFGPNPERAKNMKAEDLFDTTAQVNLARAAATGDTNRMQLLIAQGADVNYPGRKGMKPLFWALINENFRGFKFLLDHGADPNAVVAIEEPPPENALTLAASLSDSSYLQELLAHGANPNSAAGNPSQEPPIFTALLYHETNNIAILLKYKADINYKLRDDMTPLHQAISANSFAMALFLYRAGADPLIKDQWGYTAVDTMSKFGDRGVATRAEKKAYHQLLDELRQKGLGGTADTK